MADDPTSTEEAQITFNVKSSSDAKYVLTVPTSTTVADLKAKLSTSEYADLPVERQRLIYSGRVLKDPDTLASVKIKDGHTVHLVKGAASNARQNPASQGASSSTSGSTPAPPQVPTNIATGTGNNPLAQLTGARYAGFHGLPGADMFGPDGGMGPPPDTDRLLEMMEDPNFLSQMNEAMDNPAVLEMMSNNPMVQNTPMMQEILRNPETRRMLFSPESIRWQAQLQRAMNQNSGGSFPAPGVTDTTPQAGSTATGEGATATPNQPNTTGPTQTPQDPFAALLGGANAGGNNPFGALFGNLGGGPFGANANRGSTPAQSPPHAASVGQGTPANPTPTSQPPNPFANLFGGAAQQGQQGQQGADPLADMMRNMMQNPEAMRSALNLMNSMNGGASPFGAPPTGNTGAGNTGGAGLGAGTGAGAGANPFAALFGPGGGLGGLGGGLGSPPPQDNRPPEEMYESQLRQLNDMGFFDFDRNVQALRRSGGNVQGAIDHLLNSP